MRVAVIGGGPSGLVTLKYLLHAHRFFSGHTPIEAILFESAPGIGGVYLHHMYEGGEMVSSKFLTTFSDYRPRDDDPDFLPCPRYLEYLEGYAAHFGLLPYIRLSTTVLSVRRGKADAERAHVMQYRTADGTITEWQCDAIAVCTGLHSIPNLPKIPGLDAVPSVIHSSDFKDHTQFNAAEGNKTIMVLGTGETAFDIAHLAVTTTPPSTKVVLCHRDGFLGAPKRLMNGVFFPSLRGIDMDKRHCFEGQLPIDASITSLFDTMYVHPAMRDSMRVWDFYNLTIIAASWLYSGNVNAFENWIGYLPPHKAHVSGVIFNKAWERIYPYIVNPYRPRDISLLERIRRFVIRVPVPHVDRLVDLAPTPSLFRPDGVAVFKDNGRPEYQRIRHQTIRPDVVILATGYSQSFPMLQSSSPSHQNAGRKPYPTPADADVRNIWRRDDPSVAFIGLLRPGFGAIPAISEMQAMLWTMNLLGRIRNPLLPDDEWHYRILHHADSRVRYGVEHESYVYQLAKDMDAAPNPFSVFLASLSACNPRAWYRVPVVWATGSNYVVKFRLMGPWRMDTAPDIMAGELWQTVTRRTGLLGVLFLILHPLVEMGLWSLAYWVFFTVWGVLARCGVAPRVKYRNHAAEIIMGRQREREGLMREKMVNGV